MNRVASLDARDVYFIYETWVGLTSPSKSHQSTLYAYANAQTDKSP